jgi:Family of unknown function (DUF6982)
LAASTAKKVLIRRFERESLSGFVNPQAYLLPDGVELLTPSGDLAIIPYNDIKVVCFVKDFEVAPDSTEKKVFNSRPKMDGLWVRMQLRDGEVMDGILSNNLLSLSPGGFSVVPPDAYSNNQHLFIPRAALTQIHVLGVVGSPLKTRKAKTKPVPEEQISLFE